MHTGQYAAIAWEGGPLRLGPSGKICDTLFYVFYSFVTHNTTKNDLYVTSIAYSVIKSQFFSFISFLIFISRILLIRLFSLCKYRRGIIVYIEYQSVCPFVWIGPPHPQHRKRKWLHPWPLGPKWGGDTFASGGGSGGSLFRRRDRISGTLCIL